MHASAVVDLRKSFGVAFVGLLITTTLLGVTLAQTWIYFWHYGSRDRKPLKLFIIFITVMDAFNTIICAYLIYWYLVLNFGNVENLDISMWVFDIQAQISTIYTTAVILYYARRIYIVSKSIIFPIIIVALVIINNIIGIILAAKQDPMKRLIERLYTFAWLSNVAMWNTVVLDVLIAVIMCWSLYRKKTGIARTDSIIMTLMGYSINTGLVTSFLGIAMCISYTVAPLTMYTLAFFWVQNKCDVNAVLAMLNSRDYVRDWSKNDNPDNALIMSSIRIDPPSEAHGSQFRQTEVSVSLQRSTASDFASSRSDHDVGPTFEVPKQDTTIIPSQCQSQTSDVGSLNDHGAA